PQQLSVALISLTGAATLVQHARELTVQEGKAATIQCDMGGSYKYFMYWYRHGPSGSLKYIYREGDIYGEGFRDRFKGKVDSSRTTLQILAAKQEDSATYYCGRGTTLEQLCSRVDQKPTDGEDRSLSISF
uniref:Uncharacterized protein n=1 Tax=Corvus moneduloides TaxID=1196302 RepID=A0A8C3D8F5_CORMO